MIDNGNDPHPSDFKTRSCVFCDLITAKKYEAKYAGDHPVVRFPPLNPVVDGHMLFVPVAHRDNAGEDPMIAAWTMAAASQWAYGMGEAYNLITSAGEDATQSVPHLHIHYVPRRPGDKLRLPWTEQHRT